MKSKTDKILEALIDALGFELKSEPIVDANGHPYPDAYNYTVVEKEIHKPNYFLRNNDLTNLEILLKLKAEGDRLKDEESLVKKIAEYLHPYMYHNADTDNCLKNAKELAKNIVRLFLV